MTKNKAVWLAQLLFRRGRLSREEIFSAWADVDEKGQRMAPSTFYDNRNQLFSRYGIRLRSDHGYYSLDIGGGRERDFLETLLRSEGEGGAPSAIGGRQPAGFDKVAPIARAIEDGMAIGMIYAPYDKPRYSTTFSPYCLRLFRSRLYSVGFSSRHDGLRTFALDRIASLRPSSAPPHRRGNFDPRRYFAHSFGIYGGMDLKSEHIVLLADARSASTMSMSATAGYSMGTYSREVPSIRPAPPPAAMRPPSDACSASSVPVITLSRPVISAREPAPEADTAVLPEI